jgi:hypothetical protein
MSADIESMVEAMPMNVLIDTYVKARDRKKEVEDRHKEELRPIQKLMDTLSQRILNEFNELGMDSAKTDAGTAYRLIQTSATVADRDSFMRFVQQESAWDFLESRVSKKAVEEYVDLNGEVPPGVNVSRRVTVGIRRS